MRDFRRLQVWPRSQRLALHADKVTVTFAREEMYGLTSRRAAVSIAANIAEGCGQRGTAELSRFLSMAAGSASELQYHLLLLARDLGFLCGRSHDHLDASLK
jgi:four helix bundle protein